MPTMTSTIGPSATHYEVVDGKGMLVGSMHHTTEAQAWQLLNALAAIPGTGVLGVACVTETTVINRRVARIAEDLAAPMRGSRRSLVA